MSAVDVEPRFDEVLNAPHRLRIAALLSSADQVEFGVLRDHLAVADSVTSKHLKVLVDAGYARLSRIPGLGGRSRTWAELTGAGQRALRGHLADLQRMVEAARAVQPPGPGAP
ncbi:winged helix DNA-binding protein [Kineococcus xinjiangensis]|uniref:Winged helix DNA-binding protein n=1 Tax=Kineococcus xinjiangensis TaxID=512762 RepID=A0A2S6IUU0_9ACTN|nr:transcriptional regulator [Kineococcus xinjiangensis]PPK97949.1 winged helix DNA-binding protein [Kineococcus xinjiangensis]